MSTSTTTLAALLGQAADRVEVERRLEFEALPEGWTAVAGLALVGLGLWAVAALYRRETRGGASWRVRLLLASIRGGVLLGLAGIWLEPVLATYLTRWVESHCLILVDTSASMDLQDRYQNADRAARAAAVLGTAGTGPVRRIDLARRVLTGNDSEFLRELTRRNRVRVFQFGESLQSVCTLEARRSPGAAELSVVTPDGGPGQPAADLQERLHNSLAAHGSATNAVTALRQAVQRTGGTIGSPLAGVVLLTDGGFTENDAYESVAAFAREHELPLHAVGIGDPAPPRNVRVVELSAPENAFEQDPFEITAHLAASGLSASEIEVELYELPADGGSPAVKVETRRVMIDRDETLPPVTFTRQHDRLGRWIYRVTVPVGPYEAVADDNTRQVTVNVIDSRVRVLLVAGNPSWEYRYLSRLLERDDAFDVSCWLQSADLDAVRDGNTVIDRLPATAEALFEYDGIVLLDPDPTPMPAEWYQLASRLVTEYGGGLLYAAARINTPALPHTDSARPLLNLLPITLDPEADLILNRIGHYQPRPAAFLVPETALDHPALRSTGAGHDPAWDRLGAIFWHYPVLREKPAATVLMRHADPRMSNSYGGHALVATQYVGAGRSAFLAIDGTWRWRRYGEDVYNGFWVRMLRFLVEGKQLGAQKRGLILTDADSYDLGRAVAVQARVYDERFMPLQADHVALRYQSDGARHELRLQAAPDRPGWFEGRFVPQRTGSYEITLPIPTPGQSAPLTVRREVQVTRPNVEIIHPRMNRDALAALAADVPDSGYYEIDETAQIPRAIPDRHESTTVRSRPTPLWDRGWVLALLVGLLSVEWALRKWARLL